MPSGFGSRVRAIPEPGIIWSVDFSGTTPGHLDAASLLAMGSLGLVLTRASTATAQTSASTVEAGIGSDVPRIVNFDGTKRGLLVEESRTNQIVHSVQVNTPGWVAGNGAIANDFAAGPDGSATTGRVTAPSGLDGGDGTIGSTAGNYVLSVWAKRPTGAASTFQTTVRWNGGANAASVGGSSPAAWTRFTATHAIDGSTAGDIFANDGRDQSGNGGITSGARDAIIARVQAEAGHFPSSDIDTVGATSTRAADYLYLNAFSAVVNAGRLALAFTIYPLGASSEYDADMQLFDNNAGANGCLIDHTDRTVTLILGGVSHPFGTPLPTWSRGDKLEIFVAGGGGAVQSICKARVNGGSVTNCGVAAAGPVIDTSTARLDLLSSQASGRQFSSALSAIAAYDIGISPAWSE